MCEEYPFCGTSDEVYAYQLLPPNTDIPSVAGNYIFAIPASEDDWKPLYIGQTEDLKSRLAKHERYPECQRYGKFSILLHQNIDGERGRKEEEADLIERFNPPLNNT